MPGIWYALLASLRGALETMRVIALIFIMPGPGHPLLFLLKLHHEMLSHDFQPSLACSPDYLYTYK
jgi:hypothetical protein